MAFCSNCGTKLADNSKFCGTCGKPVGGAQIAVPAVQNPANVQPMNGRQLIKIYDIPESVRKQYAKYLTLELYSDRLVGKGGGNGDITYFFKNYMGITWTPASLATQFAQLVFLTHENSGNYIHGGNLNNMVDMNNIHFFSGMFSYEEANNYTKALYMDIKTAMDHYKEIESNAATSSVVQAALSPAEELKKFKELLDMGVITQEEFDAKKRQLLGL